jgi:hypothetical protein
VIWQGPTNRNRGTQGGADFSTWSGQQDEAAAVGDQSADHNHTYSGNTVNAGTHTHSVVVSVDSNGTAENRPLSATVLTCIKL